MVTTGRLAVATLSAAMFASIGVALSAPPPVEAPDWPCKQRLVPNLAAAVYWTGSSLDKIGDWHADPAIAELVRRIAPRRISTEEGLAEIAKFSTSLSRYRKRQLTLVFLGLLDETNRERDGLIEELTQIGHRQRELAGLVSRLSTQLGAIPPNASGEAAAKRIDLQQRHDFTARNFEEIQHTIRYACETPVALDARLGVWARALQNAAMR
jgi:hypothetical protein